MPSLKTVLAALLAAGVLLTATALAQGTLCPRHGPLDHRHPDAIGPHRDPVGKYPVGKYPQPVVTKG